MRTLVSILFVLAACAGADTPSADTTTPDPEPETTGPTCETAAANAATEVHADATDDQKQRLQALVLQSCTDDAWPPAAIECVAGATGDEIHHCAEQLPPEVSERLGEQVRAILEEGAGDGAVEPPPGA